MSNMRIIEDSKVGVFYFGLAMFYFKELDKHIIRRFPLDTAGNGIVLSV
jgi:hypothetical protein